MVSLDLQDAYFQVPVHSSFRHYLRFCVGELVFQFRALCFGLLTAPQAFTRVMAPVSSIMHRHGFRILRYLDDWLVLGSSYREIVRARDFLLWLCHQLGIQINIPKSYLTPTQSLDCLGMTIRTVSLRVFPTLKHFQKLSSLLQSFMSDTVHPLSVCRQLLGGDVFHLGSRSRSPAPDAIASASAECRQSFPAGRLSGLMGRLLPAGSSVVVRRVPSAGRFSPWLLASESVSLHRCLGCG